jgi:hypothetical protein
MTDAAFEAWVATARSVRIENEVARRGIKLNGNGKDRVGPCPKCGGDDRFSVHIKKQCWNCRQCKTKADKGDVIGMVQWWDGCDFIAACTTLAEPPPKQNGRDRNTAVTDVRVAECPYSDADGNLLFVVDRIEFRDAHGKPTVNKDGKKKIFKQRRPDPDRPGEWIKNVDGVPVVPYCLPELIEAAGQDQTILIVEGEAKVDLLRSWNVPATCNAMGAGKWRSEHSEYLRGADAVILPDNDAKGRAHSEAVAGSLQGIAKSVRVLELPGLGDQGDIVDWKNAGGTVERLQDLIAREAKPWVRTPDPHDLDGGAQQQAAAVSTLGERDIGDIKMPPPRGWLLGNIFARTFLSSLLAEGGTGKTALRYAQYLSLATGRSLTGEHVFVRCRVLIVSLEDDVYELERRLMAVLLRYQIDPSEARGWLFYAAPDREAGKLMVTDARGHLQRDKLADALEAVIAARKIDLAALDPFVKTHSVEENSNSAIDDVAQLLTGLAAKYDIAVDIPHHTRKGGSDPGDAERGRGASAAKDAARLVYTLTTMNSDEAQLFGVAEVDRHYFIRLDKAKVNIVPPARQAKWFRLVGVPLDNATKLYPSGDNVQTVEPWTPPELWADVDTTTLNAILTDIDAGLPDGNRFTDAPSAKDRAAWKIVVKRAPQKTETQARIMIKTWVRNGVLERYDYENPITRHKNTGLRVDDTKRPSPAFQSS